MDNYYGGGKRCPRCGGGGCQIISDTTTSGSDYGVGKGCCGYILAGPLGLLCGFCGEGKTTTTKHYWICPDCGKKFKM